MISVLVDLLGRFYASNDFVNVETIARSIHAAIPGDQVSLQFLGLAYYRTGRVKDAIGIFDKLIGRRRLAQAGKAGKTDLSPVPVPGDTAVAVCYEEATRRSPSLARVWFDLGTTLLALRKFELALPAFRSSLIAQPESPQAMLAIGQIYRKQRDFAAARACYAWVRKLQRQLKK